MSTNQINMNELIQTNDDLSLVLAGFNVDSNQIASFILTYLDTKNVTDIKGVDVRRHDDGTIDIYLFAGYSTNLIKSNANNKKAPAMMRNKLDTGGIRLSDSAASILSPLMGEFNGNRPANRRLRYGSVPKGNMVFIELDIFRCLGLQVQVDVNKHQIRILESAEVEDADSNKKGARKVIMTITKQYKHTGISNRRNCNTFDAAIDAIEKCFK